MWLVAEEVADTQREGQSESGRKKKKIEKQAKTPLCCIFPFYEPAQLDVSLSQHLSKWINLFGSLTLRLPRTEGTTA